MKTILGLAIATALASPVALAANTPDNVGDVTYLGNIVANSPMWQWTVNDYPGGRLDAKPSEVVEAEGSYTYPLNGQAFIAVSGYLPSSVAIQAATGSNIGTRDITILTDHNGSAPANITDAQNGALTFTIAASAYDTSGQLVEGKLKLKGTEVRGSRYARSNLQNTTYVKADKRIQLFGSTHVSNATPDGSCFVGTGTYSSISSIITGSAENPSPGEQSSTAFTAFVEALTAADINGNAPRYNSLEGYQSSDTAARAIPCGQKTSNSDVFTTGGQTLDYSSAAHVLELTPVDLEFSTPLSGAWNSTLTVTAYTM